MTELPIKGVGCAVATPFNKDLSIDHCALADHCTQLIADGVDLLAVLGTTSEANSLSTHERMEVLEKLLQNGIPATKLLPGTGVNATPETAGLTRHAADLGVAGVVMLPPSYYKSPSEEGIVRSYLDVLDRLGASAPRIILYNIPQMTMVPITDLIIAPLRAEAPDVFVGIKDSSGDEANMRALIDTFPGFSVFPGADPLMWPILKVGGAGCITATSNLVGTALANIYRDPESSNAQAYQDRIVKMRELSQGGYQISMIKALVSIRYGASGWTHVRPPLIGASEQQFQKLSREKDFIHQDV